MAHGGSRNKGKTWVWKKTMEREEYRKRFMERVGERWDEIIDAKIQSAIGIAIIDKKDDTGERIFDLPPNPISSKDVTDQMMGRSLQPVDLTSKGKQIGIPILSGIADALPSDNSDKEDPKADEAD